MWRKKTIGKYRHRGTKGEKEEGKDAMEKKGKTNFQVDDHRVEGGKRKERSRSQPRVGKGEGEKL